MQHLARRCAALVQEFTGGNPGIEKSVGRMWQQEQTIHGIDTASVGEMMGYLARAAAASKQP